MMEPARLAIDRAVKRFVDVEDPAATLAVLLDALDDLPVGIGLLKLPDLVFVYSNDLYESWYQRDRQPLVGRRLEDALVAAPQVVETFRASAARDTPTHFHNAKFFGLKNRPFVLPGDVTVWDWSIWPLKNAAGDVTYLLVSGYDVTGAAIDRLKAERAHEEGVRTILEVSRVAGTSGSIEDFFGELSRTVAHVVGAGKVLFATARNGVMRLQPSSYGFNDHALGGLEFPCVPQGTTLADRVVYQDFDLHAGIDSGPEFDPYRHALGVMDVADVIAVSWRVADVRLGAVAAFNSTDPEGFSERDIYLLKTAGMAAGLVWQHREDEARLAGAQEQERARLKAAADQMAALEQAKADFLRLASHEMRGPINVVSVYASMLTEATFGATSPEARDAAAAIQAKIGELNRMVDQVLEVSRLEDPALRLQLSTFDLREIVRRATDDVGAVASGHQLTLATARAPVLVHGDPDRVLMIVQNLLDNALKYSPSGGKVSCTVEQRDQSAFVVITDQGIGIADEDLPKLFGRFSRVGREDAEGIPGTGLGLYLSRNAARLLGGDVTVQSKRGEGSVFTFELPALPGPA